MEKFLALKLDSNCKIPPIDKLLKSVASSPNVGFYKIANSLHFSNYLNPIYTLISLRDIIDISPISSKQEVKEDDLKPSNSYRWLFLIHSLASKTITDDKELEEAKVTFILQAYYNFIMNCDIKKNYIVPLLSGVFCVTSRLIDSNQVIPEFLISPQIFDRMMNLMNLNAKDIPKFQGNITDFSVTELFSFCSPISLEYLSPTDLFSNPTLLLSSSVLRLLSRILPKATLTPECLESYKQAILPFCYRGIIIPLARRILIQLFQGDEDEAYKFSDTSQYIKCSQVISEKSEKTKNFKIPLSYLESINLSENLSHIRSVSLEHPKHWIAYLSEHNDMTETLLSLLKSEYDIDFVIAAATILRIGEAKLTDPNSAINLLICSRSKVLREEISKLLLLQPETLVKPVMSSFPLVCNYGSRSNIFFTFLADLLSKVSNPTEILRATIRSIHDECDEIKRLPNSHVYTQLSQFIDVPASYLDPQPCTVCNNPERQMTTKDLQDFKDYYKFTHDQIFVKLKQPYTIQTFSLSLTVKKRSRLPRTVRIYVSSAEINDPTELVTEKPNWNHVADLSFPKGSSSATAELPLRLFATCLQFHFAEFWEDTLSAMGSFTCPVCRTEITDRRSGICPKCKENAYQCRECRTINYNHLDAFICCECGYSNFVSFQWSLTALPSFSHTHITNEKDCDASLKKCDCLLSEAHNAYEKLTKLQDEIGNVLSPACSLDLSRKAAKLNDLYNGECSSIFQSLTTTVQHVCAIRSAISKFKKRNIRSNISRRSSSSISTAPNNMCYNCRSTYIKNCLKFFNTVTKYAVEESLEVPKLLFSIANENSIFSLTAIDSLVAFCSEKWELTLKVVDTFTQSLPNVQPQLVRLLCELVDVKDQQRSNRLTIFISAIKSTVKFMNSSASFTPLVLQPLFNVVMNSPLIIRKTKTYIEYTVFQQWLQNTPNARNKVNLIKLFDPLDTFILQDFCMELFLKCSSSSVRNSIASLMKDASTLSERHFNSISSLIIDNIGKKDKFNEYDMQLYQVLSFILESSKKLRVHTLQSSFFDHVIDLLCNEVDNVLSSEENISLNLSVGLPASILMNVVKIYLTPLPNLRYVINCKTDLMVRVFTSYFKLRSLLIQRSKYLDNCLSMMKEIIMKTMLKEFDFKPLLESDLAQQQAAIASASSPLMSLNQQQQIPEPQLDDDTDNEDYYSDDDDDNDNLPSRFFVNVPVSASTSQLSSPSKMKTNPSEEEEEFLVPNTLGQQILLQSSIDAFEFCPDIVIREITSVIFPPKEVIDVPILLRKQSTQEDFIPGRLPNHPLNSRKIGETFKDIKLKICNELNMQHLIQDDHGMELLVDNNIIGLSLSISEVYQRIWEPKFGKKPMIVYCRLQGLDGEATEPIIESFPTEETNDEPPEIKYAYTQVLSKNDGFKKLLDALSLASSIDNDDTISDVALNDLVKLLCTFSQIKKNRDELNKLKAIDRFFDLMKYVILNKGSVDLMMEAISTISILIKDDKEALNNKEQKVNFIFDSLDSPLIHNNVETLLSPFLSLIPPIAERSTVIATTVISRFIEKLKPVEKTEQEEKSDFNYFRDFSSLFMLNGFAEFTLALPPTDNDIRDMILNEPILKDAISYLEELFPLTERRTSDKWQQSLEVPSLPMLLKFLAGMVLNHEATQKLFVDSDAHLIRLLIELDSVSSSASIGEFASQVLRNACTEPSICLSVVDKIKKDRLEHSKQRAKEEKEKALKMAKEQISPELLKLVGELKEDSWECCICKEGYESEPKELLGVYVYRNKINLSNDFYPNTATYFVCVHPSCHSHATEENENNGGQRLGEWEAARLRNCERPCNAIFPLPNQSIGAGQYRDALQKYIDDMKNRNSSNFDYFKMFFLDVNCHLDKISKGEKIPLSNGGGSLSSIISLIPFLIYAGQLFLDGENRRNLHENRLQSLIEKIESNSSLAVETAVLSIWLLSIEEWDLLKVSLFEAILKSSKNNSSENDNENSIDDDSKLFEKVKNLIFIYVLINRFQSLLKSPSGIEAKFSENGQFVVRNHKDEKWLIEFYEKVNKNGFQIMNEFSDFAEEFEDEILEVENIKAALSYAEIKEARDDPIAWIKSVIQ